MHLQKAMENFCLKMKVPFRRFGLIFLFFLVQLYMLVSLFNETYNIDHRMHLGNNERTDKTSYPEVSCALSVVKEGLNQTLAVSH